MSDALSITYWNRLEPRPRTPLIEHALSAQVRDPLWFLTRQWQLGEFRGEDAGSIACISYAPQTIPISSLQDAAGVAPLEGPLEAAALGEPSRPDLRTRAELGLAFFDLLRAAGLTADAQRAAETFYRSAYPLPELDTTGHAESQAFLSLCLQRAVDGYRLYTALVAGTAAAPPGIDAGKLGPVLSSYRVFVEAEFSGLPLADPPRDAAAWRPERLEYEPQVVAGAIALSVDPHWDATLDWAAFDRGAPGPLPARSPEPLRFIIPAHVRFPGMPSARFWDFESSTADFGRIEPGRPDLARLLFIDFFLLHGNDWFVFPVDVPVGSLCRLGPLTAMDVFGTSQVIERAGAEAAVAGKRWTFFSSASAPGSGDAPGDWLLSAPSCAQPQRGAPLEEVRLFRDELADVVWAMEETVESPLGTPRPGAEVAPQVTKASAPPGAPLAYSIQSEVPAHWFPFVPVGLKQQQVELQLASLLYQRAPPSTRLLEPAPYRLHDHQVPRAGTSVARAVYRARWIDGSTRLWMARSRQIKAPPAASGLRFDLAEPRGPG